MGSDDEPEGSQQGGGEAVGESGVVLPTGAEQELVLLPVMELRPTQLAVGRQQVAEKAARIAGKKPKKQEKYLRNHAIPIILGPPPAGSGQPGPWRYLIDHHHLAAALLSLGISHTWCMVVEDCSATSQEHFWQHMKERGFVWPYNAAGLPLELHEFVVALPHDVAHMADDPYRSLAALVRKAGGYEKVWVPFSEFRWANWLRGRMSLSEEHPPDAPHVLALAMRHAASADAQALPGYTGAQAPAGS